MLIQAGVKDGAKINIAEKQSFVDEQAQMQAVQEQDALLQKQQAAAVQQVYTACCHKADCEVCKSCTICLLLVLLISEVLYNEHLWLRTLNAAVLPVIYQKISSFPPVGGEGTAAHEITDWSHQGSD